jgi:uncharacterized protein YecT (DUF1311 family)
LIDLGSPYSENAAEFNKARDIKFDFRAVQAIQGKTVTVGDFTSHLLSFNNLEDINNNMSIVIGEDFLKKLKSTIPEWALDELKAKSIDELSSEIYRDVTRTFELRHIYCHELALSEEVDTEIIYRCFDNTKLFLNATDTLVWNLIAPNAPTCQAEMNERAYKEFEEVDAELRVRCDQILANLEDEAKAEFQEMNEAWQKYRELKAKASADVFKGGTAWPLVYYSELYSVTKARLDDMNKESEFLD